MLMFKHDMTSSDICVQNLQLVGAGTFWPVLNVSESTATEFVILSLDAYICPVYILKFRVMLDFVGTIID